MVAVVAAVITLGSEIAQIAASGPQGVWWLFIVLGVGVTVAGFVMLNVNTGKKLSLAAALLGGIAVTVGTLGALGALDIGDSALSHSHSGGSEAPLPSLTGGPSRGAVASATLTRPADGSKVSASRGFEVGGKVTGLGKESIWIVDTDSGYTVDGEAVIVGDSWSALNDNLAGSGKKLPFSVTTVAYLASPTCAAALERIENSAGNYVVDLPSGCQAFGKVDVSVARA